MLLTCLAELASRVLVLVLPQLTHAAFLLGQIARLVVFVQKVAKGLAGLLSSQEVTDFEPCTRDKLDESSSLALLSDFLDDLTKNEALLHLGKCLGVLAQLAFDELTVVVVADVSVALLSSTTENIVFTGLVVFGKRSHLFRDGLLP